MQRGMLAPTDAIPDQFQLAALPVGGLLAGYGAWRLDEAYPLEYQMEPLVGTPVSAWSVFWLGVGVVAIGLAVADESVLDSVSLFRFTERQRSGLMASGLVLGLPAVATGVSLGLGLVVLLFAVPSGVSGLVAVVAWRGGQLVWQRFER